MLKVDLCIKVVALIKITTVIIPLLIRTIHSIEHIVLIQNQQNCPLIPHTTH